MSESKILRVSIENVAGIWPHVLPLLEEALEREETHDAEDVRALILTQRAHLWIVWTDRVEATAITEFAYYPKGIWLRAWLAGAVKGAKVDWLKWREVVREWGRANGCKQFELIGRSGWLRVFPDAEPHALVLRSPL